MVLRRGLAVLGFALWFGGLTLYSLVVIPTAHAVLRSHARVGFITQGVTPWINAAGVLALIPLLWDLLATRKESSSRLRWGTWTLMAIAQAALLALHPVLGAFLDPSSKEIAEPERFYDVHRVYLLITTAQWAAALPHLWTVLRAWTPPRV